MNSLNGVPEGEESVRPNNTVDEEFGIGDSQGETGRAVREVTRPKEPTQKELEEHMVSHLPFRSWCPYCVKGRGRSDPHRVRKEKEEPKIPVVVLDYAYLNEDDRRQDRRPILVGTSVPVENL